MVTFFFLISIISFLNYINPVELNKLINWDAVTSIATVAAVIVSLILSRKTSKDLQKQLKIEQTPFVVGKGAIFFETQTNTQVTYLANCLYLKNIGRGMAYNITISSVHSWDQNQRGQESIVLEATQSHSIDLAGGEISEPWQIHSKRLSIESDYENIDLYVYYYDQLSNYYCTKILFSKTPKSFKVMSNNSIEKFK